MFPFLLRLFIFEPKLLLSELRGEHRGLLSFLCALCALSTLVLANALVFRSQGGIALWLVKTALDLLTLLLIGAIYFPLVHLFAEGALEGSRISDLFIYGGFILSPLFLTLPAALILLLFPFGWIVYLLFLLALFARILVAFISGVRENYRLGTARAVITSFAPLTVFIVLPLLMSLFANLINV